ncbi:glycine zipper domain-containing protein [Agarivorans sp. 1_MG-2023]|uniref:glycine zipper domain-containing protein n=1 Tax=Agarivorans sp. 1_MG-2023 TaxID=3062634 RepID=UPI0026E1DA6C|nr:glycine zipper domain-containing protein [Agarivorans sp. 1_MG-2023]MDO6763806.1 glycine zipper domain-containing protein [Agarivorans sp. 1_MG-2023]
MNKLGTSISVVFFTSTLLAGCASTDGEPDPNQGMKTGAIGGAVVGLVMGAVTGDAELAVKGAVVGAAAGGAGGAMRDYENQQENRRTDTTADAISQPNTIVVNGDNKGNSQDAHLSQLLGQWQVSIWAVEADGSVTEADGTASGKMLQSDAATIDLDDLRINGEVVDLQASTTISYSQQLGHQLTVDASILNSEVAYAGEYQAEMNRFNYYPLNISETKHMRMELRVVSPQLWLVETFSKQGSEEKMIQSYRFSRAG